MTHSLLEKSLLGVKWTTLSTVINMVFQIFFMAIMARLLNPAAFGLVAMAMVTLRFANYFAQMGIGPAVVQKKVLEDLDIRVAFTISVSLGCIAAGVIYALAAMIGQWMGNNELVDVIRILTWSFVLDGLSTVPVYLLRRRFKFKALAFVESVSYVLGYGACGVLLALNGAGVYSLVGAALCQRLITFLLGYYFTRHPIQPVFERQAIKHFLGFGSSYSIIGFLEFIGSNLDTLMIGRFLGDVATGFYNRAFYLTSLPANNAVRSLAKVMFPILSEVQLDKRKIGDAYLVFLFLIGSLTGAISFGMIPAASDLVLTLLGSKWEASIPVLQVLAVSVPFVSISHISGIILDALAKLQLKLGIQSTSIIVLAISMYYFSSWGLVGFAIAVVIAQVFRSVAYFLVMKSLFDPSYKILSKIASYIIGISSLTTAIIWLAAKMAALAGLPHWGRLAMEILAGAASFFVIFLAAWSVLGQLPMYQRINSHFPILSQLSERLHFIPK